MQLFLAFVVALSVTAALIPVLARWAPAIGLTDAPGPRKVHSTPVPRVGGLAMAAGLFVATVLCATMVASVQLAFDPDCVSGAEPKLRCHP